MTQQLTDAERELARLQSEYDRCRSTQRGPLGKELAEQRDVVAAERGAQRESTAA